MKNDKPELHALVSGIRNATSTYCSNKIKELQRIAKDILKPAGSGSRESYTFIESVQKDFEKQEKSCKVKQTRGSDTTADLAKFKVAVSAFWKAYK